MRTKCSYPDCTSGTANERNYNKAHGLKNKTLFSVPKDSFRSKQWKNALGRSTALARSEVVCELHFKDADIKRIYETNLPDGSKVMMDRGRISLLDTAIPISVDTVRNSDHYTEAAKGDQNLNTDTSQLDPLIDSPTNGIIRNADTSNTSANLHPIVIASTHDEASAYQSALVDTVSDASKDIDNRTEKEIAATAFTEILRDFEKIKHPDGWVCVDLTKHLVVAQWNPDGSSMKQLFVHPDSSVTAYIRNRKTNVPGIINIRSAQDILYNINIMQPLLLCNGIGNEYGHSEQCLGFSEPKLRVKFGHNRCASCHATKRRIIRQNFNYKKRQAMLKKKCEKKKKSLKAEKEKVERMKCKISALKEEVLRTRRKCTAACKDTLEREISKLNPNQQETVKVCVDATKCSKEGRQYTRQ